MPLNCVKLFLYKPKSLRYMQLMQERDYLGKKLCARKYVTKFIKYRKGKKCQRILQTVRAVQELCGAYHHCLQA